ncbi:MAG: leucyl/phenylalanyl-tRNA--protein transferase [Osedax symbiont Rs1]|nr:MAG: leucyl/phenylalanyl-tRNA--protein transferase [Osedax symbiont Rs1]
MVPWLSMSNHSFPAIDTALAEPNGLLAAGGDLTPNRLIAAYKKGIFPWFNQGEPILWWSPAPRCVLIPSQLHISKSLKKQIKKNQYRITFDLAFNQVIQSCSEIRASDEGTWITDDIQQAYCHLFDQGVAHSIEVWDDNLLVGGLYGLALGRVFFGESMFSRRSNTSKIAFCYLAAQLKQWGFQLIDCQVHNNHLQSLGATEISRELFLDYLNDIDANSPTAKNTPWKLTINPTDVLNV